MPLYKTLIQKISIPPDKKTKQSDYQKNGLIKIVDQGYPLVSGYTNNQSMQVLCKLPVIVFGDHTRAVKYIDFPFAAGADGIKVLQPKEGVHPKYLYFCTQYIVLGMEDHGYARHYQYLEKKEISTPDMSEQIRIVTYIEELFSELDKAVETMQTIKQQLSVYRQAVLKEAFEGLEGTSILSTVAEIIDPQPSHRTPSEHKDGVPYVGIGDVDYSTKEINFSNARKVATSVLNDHKDRYTLQEGDFIIGKIGTIGKPFKIELPQTYTLSANVILVQPNRSIVYPDFLFHQLSSPYITQQLIDGTRATSQPAFGIQKARSISIKICSLIEQQGIVTELEEKISICDNIEQTVNIAMNEASALRKSILKYVFEGRI